MATLKRIAIIVFMLAGVSNPVLAQEEPEPKTGEEPKEKTAAPEGSGGR